MHAGNRQQTHNGANMKKLTITIALLAAAAQALAMPTREELSQAQPLVNELMTPALEEYKSAADKTAAAISVGDRSCAFAAEAETEAAKFLLLKGAVNYYVRGEAYDKAADCIATMQADISNLSPDAVAEIVGKATSRISESVFGASRRFRRSVVVKRTVMNIFCS